MNQSALAKKLASLEKEMAAHRINKRYSDLQGTPFPSFRQLQMAVVNKSARIETSDWEDMIHKLCPLPDVILAHAQVIFLVCSLLAYTIAAFAYKQPSLLLGVVSVIIGLLCGSPYAKGCGTVFVIISLIGAIYLSLKAVAWVYILMGGYVGYFLGIIIRIHYAYLNRVVNEQIMKSELLFSYLFSCGKSSVYVKNAKDAEQGVPDYRRQGAPQPEP